MVGENQAVTVAEFPDEMHESGLADQTANYAVTIKLQDDAGNPVAARILYYRHQGGLLAPAWGIGSLCENLGTANYLVGVLGDAIPLWVVSLMVFFLPVRFSGIIARPSPIRRL